MIGTSVTKELNFLDSAFNGILTENLIQVNNNWNLFKSQNILLLEKNDLFPFEAPFFCILLIYITFW